MSNKLTEEELKILFEYAQWYDSYLGSPSDLIKEFEQQRGSNQTKTKKETNELKAISI